MHKSLELVYPASRIITGEGRAEFLRAWGHGFEQEGAGGGKFIYVCIYLVLDLRYFPPPHKWHRCRLFCTVVQQQRWCSRRSKVEEKHSLDLLTAAASILFARLAHNIYVCICSALQGSRRPVTSPRGTNTADITTPRRRRHPTPP